MNNGTQEKYDKIKNSVSEAKRFIEKAEEAMRSLEEQKRCQYQNYEFSACKRASLDLSRSLSKMRKN